MTAGVTHATSANDSPMVDWSAYLLAMHEFQAFSSSKYRKHQKEDKDDKVTKTTPQEEQPEAPEATAVVESDATIHQHSPLDDEDVPQTVTVETVNLPESPGTQVDDSIAEISSTVKDKNQDACREASASITEPASPPAVDESMAPRKKKASVPTSPRQPVDGMGSGNNAEKQSYINEKEIEPEESKSPAMRANTKDESDDESNGSDEVIFRQDELNMVGPRVNASASRHGRARLVNASSAEPSKVNKPPVQKHSPANSPTAVRTQPTNHGRSKVIPERATGQNRQQVQTPTKGPKNKKNMKEELKKLQEEEMRKFGRKQMGLDPEANPKTGPLHLARQGPGADPNSPFMQELQKRIDGAPDPLLLKGSRDTSNLEEAGSPMPSGSNSSESKRVTSGASGTGERLEIKNWDADKDKEGFSPVVVDWQYRPWETYGDEHFVRNFRNWLENTMRLGYPVDTKHESFRDGTSIPDGVGGMACAKFEVLEARVDPDDPENQSHAHEAAAGYAHNWNLRLEQEAAEKEQQRVLQKRAIQAPSIPVTAEEEPNPYAPKAKVYFRPVEDKDIPALVALYNWYIRNTARLVESVEITQSEMEEQIQDAEGERLPFVVAAEHKPHQGHAMNGREEMVYGFASVCDFTGPKSTQRCSGEVEVLVHPKMHRSGIGRCLLDKVVEICDPKYLAKRGYSFDCAPDKRHIYCAGNTRPLSRLIMVVHHHADDPTDYKWIKSWLEKEFQFEEQGVLKGVGAKKGKLLNSGYLVYNTSVKHR